MKAVKKLGGIPFLQFISKPRCLIKSWQNSEHSILAYKHNCNEITKHQARKTYKVDRRASFDLHNKTLENHFLVRKHES